MENFTIAELSDILFMVDELEMVKKFKDFMLSCKLLHHIIFAHLHHRLRENGTFIGNKQLTIQAPFKVRTMQPEEAVLALIADAPETSTRQNCLHIGCK